ncbi:MAG: cadherin-like domain-containing protein, partial [Devosia sp.]
MIIEGKANRQPSEPVDPRKRLEFNTPEKASRVPIYFALLLTGIAAYLKSAFPAQSQGDAPPAEDGLSSANSSAPRGGRMAPGRPEIDEITTGGIGDEDADNTVGGSLGGWSSGFSMPDPVSLNYAASSSEFMGPQVAAFFPAAFNYQPQNDNVAAQGGSGAPTGQGPDVAPSGPPVDEDAPDTDDEDDEDDDDDDNEPTSANRAPTVVGPVRLRDVFAGQIVLIGLSDLLFGASDPDGNILSINDITATGGTLVQVGAGWSLVTLPGMLGIITFTYNISDGLIEILQTASLQVVRNSVLLTPWDDVFVGTPWDDDIDGLAGDDIIDARAGNDFVVGGDGDDHINGGDGDDQLFGGLGDDVIFGGHGDDLIGGGAGNDRLFGEDGDDTIEGDQGDDILMGGTGNDILDGGDGDDQLEGNEGNDVLVAG